MLSSPNKKLCYLYSFLKDYFASLNEKLQHQNNLISSERPFKILQNETKIIKIGQAVLQKFSFKNHDLDNFMRKNDKMFFRGLAQTEEQQIVLGQK